MRNLEKDRISSRRRHRAKMEAKRIEIPKIDGEIWKPILGYEGLYEISNKARVKSLSRIVSCRNKYESLLPEKLLKQGCTKGYFHVSLAKNSINKIFKVHRLVAIAFISNPENKYTVNHKDLNSRNNFVENLEWNTSAENTHHYAKTKTKTGFIGVTWNKSINRFIAAFLSQKKRVYVGCFKTRKVAIAAYIVKKELMGLS
jgi:hypothetical protein